MEKKLNNSFSIFRYLIMSFIFVFVAVFFGLNINAAKIDAAVGDTNTSTVFFVKGEEEDFDGNVVVSGNYFTSNVKEAIQLTGTTARAYIILPTGFDVEMTYYQYVVNQDEQFEFDSSWDATSNSNWKQITESKFITLDGFDNEEGIYYVHVRYKLKSTDEITRVPSTEIIVDNTAPGINASFDPSTPTKNSVTVTPVLSNVFGYDGNVVQTNSSLETIEYKVGSYSSLIEFDSSSEVKVNLLDENLNVKKIEATSNISFTICAMDRAGNRNIYSFTIDNIYSNLVLSVKDGILEQRLNDVSDVTLQVSADEGAVTSTLNWYISINNEGFNKIAGTTGAMEYLHRTENEAGLYTIKVIVGESDVSSNEINIRVRAGEIIDNDIDWNVVEIKKVYDGTTTVNQPIEGLKLKDSVLDGKDVKLTLSNVKYASEHASSSVDVIVRFRVSGADVGQFDFSPLLVEGEESLYQAVLVKGVIEQRKIAVTLEADSRPYNGSKLVDIKRYTLGNILDGDKEKLSINVYSDDTKIYENYGVMNDAKAGTGKVVKTYIVLNSTDLNIIGDYVIDASPLMIDITKIEVSIKLEDKTSNYGESVSYKVIKNDCSSLIVGSSMVSGETLSTIDYNFDQIVIYEGNRLPTNVGDYTITLTGMAESDNYTFTYQNGSLKISAVDLKITYVSTENSKVYDGVDEIENLKKKSLYSFETFKYNDANYLESVVLSSVLTEVKNVGSYNIVVVNVVFAEGYEYLVNNYKIASEVGTYTITRKLITLEVLINDKVYDGTTEMTVSKCGFVGLVDGESLNAECTSPTTQDPHVSYRNNQVASKPVDYKLVISSDTGLLANYEWQGIDDIVNSESANYKVSASAKITPRSVSIENLELFTKSYDGTRTILLGETILSIAEINEEIKLKWETNLEGYASANASSSYDNVVTLSNPVLMDYELYLASDYSLIGTTTKGMITPVDVDVDFKKVSGEPLKIVYDGIAHLFGNQTYYSFDYENSTVELNGNEETYVLSITYEAYKDELLVHKVDEIKDINVDEFGNTIPYYIKIISVNLDSSIVKDNYNFIIDTIGQVIISKQPLNVTFKTQERSYTGLAVTNEFDKLDFTITGMLDGEESDLSSLVDSITYKYCINFECSEEISNPVNVGTYYVVGTNLVGVDGVDLTNYDITYYRVGTFTITPIALSVYYAGNGTGISYNGVNNELSSSDFEFIGLVGNDNKADASVVYLVDGESTTETSLLHVKRTIGYAIGSNVGVEKYSILVDSVSASYIGNYTLDFNVPVDVENTFTINPLELVLSIKAIDREYDGTTVINFEEENRYVELVSGEKFNVEYTSGSISSPNVGNYSVTYDYSVTAISPTSLSNYYWSKPSNPMVRISAKVLNSTDFLANNLCEDDSTKVCKVYDGTSSLPDGFSLTATTESGVLADETLVISFDGSTSKFVTVEDNDVEAIDAGEAKILVSNIEVSGNINYIIDPTMETLLLGAIISQRVLDVEKFVVNDKNITKLYDDKTEFTALSINVTQESGLQVRDTILDEVIVTGVANFSSEDVRNDLSLKITNMVLSGTHANNYLLSSVETTRTNNINDYVVKINPIEILSSDIKSTNLVKTYDSTKNVPEGFTVVAANATWPDVSLNVYYNAEYESEVAANEVKIIIKDITYSSSNNYVIKIDGNKVEHIGKIEKYKILISNLIIEPLSKKYDGLSTLTFTSLAVGAADMMGEDEVKIVSPTTGTFVDPTTYVENAKAGIKKIELTNISLDDDSKVNYMIVDEVGNEILPETKYYLDGEIIALNLYVTFISNSQIYNGKNKDLSAKDPFFEVSVDPGDDLPSEILSITNYTYTVTKDSLPVTEVKNVGTYTVTPTGDVFSGVDVSNYQFILNEGTYTITPREASISLKENLSAIYNGSEVDLTDPSNWEIEYEDGDRGFVETIDSVLVNAGEGVIIKNAGTYYSLIAGKINGIDSNNYIITRGSGVTFVVNKKLVNVTVTINSREYDGTVTIDSSLFNVEINQDDLVEGEDLNYTVSSATIEAPDASTTPYEVTYTLTLTNGLIGKESNYQLGNYGSETIIINKREIKNDKLSVENPDLLYKDYDGTLDFTNSVNILVGNGAGGLVKRLDNAEYDVVAVKYTSAQYKSKYVGKNNSVILSGLFVELNNNYTIIDSAEFTHSDGSLIRTTVIDPRAFELNYTTKVYDGEIDETDTIVITPKGLFDDDADYVVVTFSSAKLSDRSVGTRVLLVENMKLVDKDEMNPVANNYQLNSSYIPTEFVFEITAKRITSCDVEAYYNDALISHDNPLRMTYVPGNSEFKESVDMRFKDGTIVHRNDVVSINVTSINFVDSSDNLMSNVNNEAATYYNVKITFTVSTNENYIYEMTLDYIVVEDAGVIDPIGVIMKAKRFTKEYGSSETNHEYLNPTSYEWVYTADNSSLSSDDYSYLTTSIEMNISREINREKQNVGIYDITITYNSDLTGNYFIVIEKSTLEITKRVVNVLADEKTISYDSTDDYELTYTFINDTSLVIWDVNGLPATSGEKDTLTNVLAVFDNNEVALASPYVYGTYTIVKHPDADASNPNYNIIVNSSSFKVIDEVKPQIFEIKTTGWNKSSATVSFKADDFVSNASGIDNNEVKYCDENGIECKLVTHVSGDDYEFTVGFNGNYVVKIKDKAGNETTTNVEVYTIIEKAPEMTIDTSPYVDGQFINVDLDIKVNVKSTTEFKFDETYYTELFVSIDGREYELVGKVSVEEETKVYNGNYVFKFTKDHAITSGEHEIKFKAVDVAENSNEASTNVITLYTTTVEKMVNDNASLEVEFGINNFDVVESMIESYKMYYFYSRNHSSIVPTVETFMNHGVPITMEEGKMLVTSPMGLQGNYRLNVLMIVKYNDGSENELIYQSNEGFIRRASSQPQVLNSTTIVDNDNAVMSYLANNGSSIVVSNENDMVSLSSKINTYNYIRKYDADGTLIYNLKLNVVGNYEIVNIEHDGSKEYILTKGMISSVNGLSVDGEGNNVIVVIENGKVSKVHNLSVSNNMNIVSMDVNNGKVALVGSTFDGSVVIYTDMNTTWTRVISGIKYTDVSINSNMIVAVGSTSLAEFVIDDKFYNGSVDSKGNEDAIMVSFDLDNNVQFVRRLTGDEDSKYNLVELDDSKIVVSGVTKSNKLYHSKYAYLLIGDNESLDAFVVSYDLDGMFTSYSALSGENDEEINSITLVNNRILVSVITNSSLIVPNRLSGNPIEIVSSGKQSIIVNYNEYLEIEDVTSSSSGKMINGVTLDVTTSQLMLLSEGSNSLSIEKQRFILSSDIALEQEDKFILINVDNVNIKLIKVMKDGELISMNENQFKPLGNGVYTISVVDEYDSVAVQTIVIDNINSNNKVTNNTSYYMVLAISVMVMFITIAINRKRRQTI